ncbi:MAG TPA: complex I subunit 1 family protein, partial [Thermoguttaceae bacterium]|nr:complex I subunit 1 family protein [Thermoguttaceae bacterium]
TGLESGQEPIRLVVAPGIDVGMIYVFAVGGIAVYGVLLGGWASNNKYSLFGGLRSGAQLISYELPLGLGILGVVLATGSLRLDAIIAEQAQSGTWNVLVQPLGFVVFFVAAFAEAGRLPFDLPEAEQELVGGYHTEYSGVKLMMYLVAEFLHMIAAAFLIVILFFGGWHFWGVTGSGEQVTWVGAILRVIVLLGKVMAAIYFFMLARWSWPRFRFDQLMTLAWKVMLPLGLVNVVVVAAWIEYGEELAARLGVSPAMSMAVLGWFTLIAAGVIVTAVVPAGYDNRPRRGALVPGTEGEKAE